MLKHCWAAKIKLNESSRQTRLQSRFLSSSSQLCPSLPAVWQWDGNMLNCSSVFQSTVERKKKNLWPLEFFSLQPCSLWLDSQCDLQVLVDHVADADRWNDLHEVGCQPPVESYGPLSPNNVSEQFCHVHLRAPSQRGCGNRGKMRSSNSTL